MCDIPASKQSQSKFWRLDKSSSKSISSKRKREVRIKAAVPNLQAKQLAEQVKREKEVREQEFRDDMAQRELELKLEYRKREFEIIWKKRESEKAVIAAQNEAELAQLEHKNLKLGVQKKLRIQTPQDIPSLSRPTCRLVHHLLPVIVSKPVPTRTQILKVQWIALDQVVHHCGAQVPEVLRLPTQVNPLHRPAQVDPAGNL